MSRRGMVVGAVVVSLLGTGVTTWKIDALKPRVEEPSAASAAAMTAAPTPGETPSTTARPSFATSAIEAAAARDFPNSVWLQDPADSSADYKALGVTTFLGLWEWPADRGKWPGWAQASLDEMAKLGMKAYAGESPTAIRATLQMPNNQVVEGWLAGDEPDMFGPDPATWAKRVAAMKAVADRPIAANFGLGFGGFGWWYDHISDRDRAAWCKPIDLPSVDLYGMSRESGDPTGGAWTYGRAIENLKKACGDSKPLGAFVETTEVSEDAPLAATPAGMRAAAWNAVIHGADSINWFVHDFKCNPECGPSAFLREPKWEANRSAMKAVNATLTKWSSVLATPDVKGRDEATASGLPLHLLTKRHNGVTYIFAQSAGDQTMPGGYSGKATIKVGGRSFTDTWSPNQVRIYSVDS